MRGLVIAVPTWVPGWVPAGTGRAVTRRAGLAAVLLAMLLAGLAAAAGSGLIPSWRPLGPLPLPENLLLPWLAALLGMVGGALALFAARPMPAVPLAPGRAADSSPTPDVAVAEPPVAKAQAGELQAGALQAGELQAAVLELRALLRDERAELATLRETSGRAAHEATMVGARLAGVALDAEARLTAGIVQAVTQAGEALQRPDQAGARLADATHFTQAADAAARTIAATAVTAADQVAALGEVAGVLRRDAMALDAAGREIATAGAHMLARLGEAVGQADAALTRLPQTIGDVVHEASGQAGETIAEAAACVAAQLTGLRTEMTQTRAEMAAEIAAAESVLRDFAGLPGLTEELAAAASALRGDTAALGRAERQTVAATEQMAARLATDLTRAETALAGLAAVPGLTEDFGAAAAALRREAVTIGHAAQEAGREAMAAAEAAAARLSAEAAGMRAGIEAAAHALPRTAAAFSAACEDGMRSLAQTAAALCADGAALGASGRDAAHATAALRHEAQFLVAAGREVAGVGGDVVARLSATAAQMAQAATEADIRADETAAAAAALPRLAAEFAANLTAELAHASAALRLDAGVLGEAGSRVASAAGQAEAAIGGLPGLASEIATAVGGLERETCVLTAAARQMALTGLDATARVELSAASLDASGRALGVAGDALLSQFDRLQTAVTRHDHAGHAVVAAMARVEAASEEVARAAGRRPADLQISDDQAATAASLESAVLQLGGVARDAEILLRQTEALAEAVLAGDAPALPPSLGGRAPELLTSVETTIRRLRSVATALALVSDGSPRDAATDGAADGPAGETSGVRGAA